MKSKKNIIREKMALSKKSLSDEKIMEKSKLICDRLVQTLLFQESNRIAFYCATDNEVSTYELMDKYRFKKHIVLPVISIENMNFYPYTGKENLKKGAFGILEPISRDIVPPEDIDLFIVPGVAFDYLCNRMGRGKGYYDRFLSNIDKPTIGLCFEFQLMKYTPHESHDKKMTIVLTENATILQQN